VNQWLSRRADALAAAAAVERSGLELDDDRIEVLLDLAGYAAHDSGARTNAPLLCYLLGRAEAGGAGFDELAEAVRRSSS
jgi:Domain of unknown function (DUF6457)